MDKKEIILKNDNLRNNRKEEIIGILKDSFADGFLQLDEYESRVTLAERAESLDELNILISDIPAEAYRVQTREISETESISCKMANKKIAGSFLRTRKLKIEASMATIKLDYRDLPHLKGIQEINVNMEMSNLILYLPEDIAVENRVQEEMSQFRETRTRHHNPAQAQTIITIIGKSKMSNIRIKRKRYWFISKKR